MGKTSSPCDMLFYGLEWIGIWANQKMSIYRLYNTIKYQGGHMMRNADARTVRSRQETFNSNGGHNACFDDFKHQ